jgi:hypothetical protein
VIAVGSDVRYRGRRFVVASANAARGTYVLKDDEGETLTVLMHQVAPA